MRTALPAAVLASLAYGVASVLQASAALAVARDAGAGTGAGTGAGAASGSTARVLARPSYLLGLGADLLGWVLSLVAVRGLPLFAVQAVLAASLAVTVLLAARVLGARLRRRDAVAVAAVVTGSAVLAASARGRPAPPVGPGVAVGVAAAVGVVAVASALGWRRGPALGPAVLAGTGYGLAAVAARAVHPVRPPAGWLSGPAVAHLAANPLVWAVLVGNLVGTVVYARALQRAAVGPAAAGLWVAEVVVPGALGLALLGDTVRPGWGVPALLATVAVLAAVVVLAGAPGTAAAAEAAAT